jgi:hypothetical protein
MGTVEMHGDINEEIDLTNVTYIAGDVKNNGRMVGGTSSPNIGGSIYACGSVGNPSWYFRGFIGGSIYTNSDFYAEWSSMVHVDGDVYYGGVAENRGEDWSLIVDGSIVKESNTVKEMPLIELPIPDEHPVGTEDRTVGNWSETEPEILPPGTYDDIYIDKYAALVSGTYNLDTLAMTGSGARLYIDARNGPVIINTHSLTLQNLGMLPYPGAEDYFRPINIQVNMPGTGTNTIDLGVSGTLMGVISAGGTDLTLTGGVHFYGAVFARSLTFSGGAAIHVDEALLDEYENGGGGEPVVEAVKIIRWKETT